MHYVLYEMTWAEYELRLFSYKRQIEREERNFREVAWASLLSFNVDPKRLPQTKAKFWPIGSDNKIKKVTSAARSAYEKAMSKYLESKK